MQPWSMHKYNSYYSYLTELLIPQFKFILIFFIQLGTWHMHSGLFIYLFIYRFFLLIVIDPNPSTASCGNVGRFCSITILCCCLWNAWNGLSFNHLPGFWLFLALLKFTFIAVFPLGLAKQKIACFLYRAHLSMFYLKWWGELTQLFVDHLASQERDWIRTGIERWEITLVKMSQLTVFA